MIYWGLSRGAAHIQKIQDGEWKLVEHDFGVSRKCQYLESQAGKRLESGNSYS